MAKESLDIDLIFNDIYEEHKEARYCELVGHTNKHLYTHAKHWNEEVYDKIAKQGKEQEQFNCPSYGENNLKYVASEAIFEKDPATCYMKWGETCMICLEQITNQKNAYLTECNHAIHKTCVTSLWNTNHFANMAFKCPLCRANLSKCVWLQPRYALEPWRIPYRKKPRCNLDFESQKDLFNEDIITCKGCPCTKGCFGIVGKNFDCVACHHWRYFTLNDLQHNSCKCSLEEEKCKKKKSRNCTLFTAIYYMIWPTQQMNQLYQ